MTDDLHEEEEKEVEPVVPGVIAPGAEEELEVPHDDFDALFPADVDSLEEEDGVGVYKGHNNDDEEDDFPFSAELE